MGVGAVLAGVAAGGALSLMAMFALGVLHRYLFGPPTLPFGDSGFFSEMSVWGLLALAVVRVIAAWIGGWTAARVSGEPRAAWTGPATVLAFAVVVVASGMSQPLWSLVLCGVLLVAVGWTLSRSAAGLPLLPAGLRAARD